MRDKTKQRIFDAAIPLFAEKGFVQTSVHEIAGRAGMSVGLLYRHFKTKEEVFSALVSDTVKDLKKEGEMLASIPCPKQAFMEFAKHMHSNIVTDSDDAISGLRGIVLQQVFMDRELPWIKNMIDKNTQFMDIMATIVKRGQDVGLFKHGDPHAMVMHFVAQCNGAYLVQRCFAKDYRPPTLEMITAFILKEEL